MHLSFRYPASWQVTGRTLVSTMGNVGEAELITGTSGSLHDLMTASCYGRGAALGPGGVFVIWGANLGAPSPLQLNPFRGQTLRVHGHPASWSEETSTSCFKGRIISGVIQESPHTFLFMHADIGSAVPASTIRSLRAIFISARG